MRFINLASGESVWRGNEYFIKKHVIDLDEIDDMKKQGKVRGSGEACYDVFIDLEHPRSSRCNCPHADGRRVICKHMIALYFASSPEAVKKYNDALIAYEHEEAEWQKEIGEKVISLVTKMKKAELQDLVFELLDEGPDWQYERFVRKYIE